MLSVNGKDVKFESFDNILDAIGNYHHHQQQHDLLLSLLGDSPNEVALEFIKPNDVFKGPAIVTVITPDGITSSLISSILSLSLSSSLSKREENTNKYCQRTELKRRITVQ